MTIIETFRGVNSIVQTFKSKSMLMGLIAIAAVALGACSGGPGPTAGGADPNEVAARVNGKDIKMEEVEKAIKAQARGTEANFSPLELASARLSILQQLIETEVLFQKAEKEQTVPSEEEVTAEMNKRKTGSGLSAEEFDRQMKAAGETEQTWRANVKKELALQRLQDKITGKVESPKDSEIEAFFNGNREQFKNKRGAELAAIVLDPANSGQGDTTTNDAEVQMRLKELAPRLANSDFATLAREFSEDFETRSRGGDWRYFSEDELKQTFGEQVSNYIMNQMQNGQIFPQPLPLEGKIIVMKLQRKQEKDEDLTLESPQVRPRITELLINARKNLLWQSYMAMAINEAKVENLLAKKVVENPNELSGARPAPQVTPADANTNTAPAPAANTNAAPAANANTASNASANTNARPAANANR
ncbi:MAG: SurA N-terminal domain-containing protein [Pyrinomonadaceae bacterium]|nr:SurA N-terminal domain-containing protein [Pyrinomonadaceae bacterium]